MEINIHSVRAYLKHKLIEDLDIIDNYTKESNALHNIIKSTILNGESQSVLVMGPRGSGKSIIVKNVLHKLSKTINVDANCIEIELNGLIHTDDNLALKSCTTQMCLDEAANGKIFGTFAENLAFLLECLLTGNRATVKCLLFIIDEFDLFCYHDNQTLLYNLLDMTNYSQIPICVVGLTCRLDVVELFEKRVKSRFSHRVINIFPAPDLFTERLDLCKKMLSIHVNNKSAIGCEQWNNSIKQLIKSIKFQTVLKSLYETTKCYRVLKNILIQAISSLNEQNNHLTSDMFKHYVNHFCVGYKSQIINSLSILEMCLIIAMQHHCEIYDNQPFNFEMILQRFLIFADQNNKSFSASRSVALKAFQHIKNLELISEVSATQNSHRQPEYEMFNLSLQKEQLIQVMRGSQFGPWPTEVKQWCESK